MVDWRSMPAKCELLFSVVHNNSDFSSSGKTNSLIARKIWTARLERLDKERNLKYVTADHDRRDKVADWRRYRRWKFFTL